MKQIVYTALVLFTVFSNVFAGSLQPSAAPTTGTMKTLDEVEPRTAIPGGSYSTSYSIMTSGSYYLAGNRTFTAQGEGIFINASNVTLDLKGFTFSGTASSLLNGIGIGQNCNNVEISNGTVTGFKLAGITDFNDSNRDIRIVNVRSLANKAYGICLSGKGNRIENCLVANNGIDGIKTGENSVIANCIARDQNSIGSIGISVESGSVVTGCSSSGNKWSGITAWGAGVVISDNSCYGNGLYGISATTGGMTVIGNNCKNNTLGIYSRGVIKNNLVSDCTAEHGLHALPGSTVVNNTAINNRGNGFFVESCSVVIGNSSYNNGSEGLYCYGFRIEENCLVDQNLSYGNHTNMNTLVNCTVPSGNHAPLP